MQFDLALLLDQLFSSGLTACFTIIGGVTILVMGQLAMKLFIEPILEQAKLVGEIAHSTTFYANVFGSAKYHDEKIVKEASETLRRQASQLRASAWTIRWYWLWQTLRLVQKRKSIMKVSEYMIGLSNSMDHIEGARHFDKEIKSLLGFN